MIYKMLARYKGEFTVFRELIQNADDAGASQVEINSKPHYHLNMHRDYSHRHYSPHSSHVVFREGPHNAVKRIAVSNNGAAFTDQDWARITKIASGNPNEYVHTPAVFSQSLSLFSLFFSHFFFSVFIILSFSLSFAHSRAQAEQCSNDAAV